MLLSPRRTHKISLCRFVRFFERLFEYFGERHWVEALQTQGGLTLSIHYEPCMRVLQGLESRESKGRKRTRATRQLCALLQIDSCAYRASALYLKDKAQGAAVRHVQKQRLHVAGYGVDEQRHQ